MRTTRKHFTLSLGLLIITIMACKFNVSTANISSLKLGKDKSLSQPTTNFEVGDTVYAVADISNASSPLKVKGRLVVEAAEGQQSGPLPGLEKIIDMPGSGTATFNFFPSPEWPKGKYKVEIFMLNEEGEQKDQKSETFTIS